MTESVMVLIPLLITFLSVLQISTGVMARTVSSNVVQGDVANSAISQNYSDSTSSSAVAKTVTNQYQLPGGGSFSIGSQSIHKPAVSPLLPGGDNYEATGLAITE